MSIDLNGTFKLAMSTVKINANAKIPEKIHADPSKRIAELGLNNLQESDRKERFDIIEDRLWTLADKVNKPIIFYELEDYETAINFLEIFSVYAFCLGRQTLIPLQTDAVFTTELNKINIPVLKLIRELENLNKIVHGSTEDKVTLKTKIKSIKKHVDKVFLNDLGKTEQRALGKTVNDAKEILSHLA